MTEYIITPLYTAVEKGDFALVQDLVLGTKNAKKADVNEQNYCKYPPWGDGDWEMDKSSESPIFPAIRSGNKDMIDFLIDNGANINQGGNHYSKRWPLCMAKSAAIAFHLIHRGAREGMNDLLNKEDFVKEIFLHCKYAKERSIMATAFVSSMYDLPNTWREKDRRYVASRSLLQFLISQCVDITWSLHDLCNIYFAQYYRQDEDRLIPKEDWDRARCDGVVSVIDYLVREYKMDVNAKWPYMNNKTPLHLAAIRNVEGTVRKLLELGADPMLKDDSGMIPLDYVEYPPCGKTAGLLVNSMRKGGCVKREPSIFLVDENVLTHDKAFVGRLGTFAVLGHEIGLVSDQKLTSLQGKEMYKYLFHVRGSVVHVDGKSVQPKTSPLGDKASDTNLRDLIKVALQYVCCTQNSYAFSGNLFEIRGNIASVDLVGKDADDSLRLKFAQDDTVHKHREKVVELLRPLAEKHKLSIEMSGSTSILIFPANIIRTQVLSQLPSSRPVHYFTNHTLSQDPRQRAQSRALEESDPPSLSIYRDALALLSISL